MVDLILKITKKLNINFIYKTSFDKANRTSLKGKRGIGLEKSLSIFDDIKKKFNLNVIKAIKVKTEDDLKQIDTYTHADDLLLDTPAMEQSELFNFNLLDYRNINSYFLAGGINIDNVAQALQFTSKLDISSGLESEPGVKDLEKIKDCMKEVKRHA